MSSRADGVNGRYTEPSPELSFRNFVTPLLGRAIAVAQTQPQAPAVPPRVVERPVGGSEPTESSN
jgi:hypothetical protein